MPIKKIMRTIATSFLGMMLLFPFAMAMELMMNRRITWTAAEFWGFFPAGVLLAMLAAAVVASIRIYEQTKSKRLSLTTLTIIAGLALVAGVSIVSINSAKFRSFKIHSIVVSAKVTKFEVKPYVTEGCSEGTEILIEYQFNPINDPRSYQNSVRAKEECIDYGLYKFNPAEFESLAQSSTSGFQHLPYHKIESDKTIMIRYLPSNPKVNQIDTIETYK